MDRIYLAKVRQRIQWSRTEDIQSVIMRQTQRLAPAIQPGITVAVTPGCRGINPLILETLVQALCNLEPELFIGAAMEITAVALP